MTQLTPQRARRVSRRWPLISGGVAIALALALGAIVALRSAPYEFDAEWLEEVVEHRAAFWTVPALVMNFVGGSWFGVFVVPIGAAIVLRITGRPWSAFYFVVASAVSAGLVQLLKALFDRARPEDMLLAIDSGSFPSGHAANAATIAVALGLMLQRRWVWIAGAAYALLMAVSRTYLGVHWLSDTTGGLLLGAGVAVVLWAPFAAKLEAEWRPAPASVKP